MKRIQLRNIPIGAKASIAFFLGSIVSRALAYITTPIYTRLLTADEYGKSAVWYTWLQLLGVFSMFCLSSGVYNNGLCDYSEKRDEYSFSMLGLSIFITLFFSVLFLGTFPWTQTLLDMSFPMAILMCLIFLTQPAYNFWIVKQRYEFKYKYPFLWTIIISVLSPTVAIICILLFPDNRLYGRLFGGEGILIIIYFIFAIQLARKNSYRICTKYWKEAFSFNLPLIPHYFSILVLGSSDRIMISKLVGDEQAAYYSVAYSIAIGVSIVWSAINSSLVPYTYEKCKEGQYTPIAKLTYAFLLLFAFLAIFASLISPEIVRIMATEDYMQAVFIIPPVIAGVFFQVQYFVFANLVYYYKKPKYVMYASLFSAALNVVLNLLFIPIYGYIAAAYTTLFSYIVQAALDYFAMKKAVGFSIYNMKRIILMSIAVLIVSFGVFLIYPYREVRYFFVATIIVCAFLFRHRLYRLSQNLYG